MDRVLLLDSACRPAWRFWTDEVMVSKVLGLWAGPRSGCATKSFAGSGVMRVGSRTARLQDLDQGHLLGRDMGPSHGR